MYRAFQAIRYRGPTRLVPVRSGWFGLIFYCKRYKTFGKVSAKDIRLLGKFQNAAGSDLNTSCKSFRLIYHLQKIYNSLGKFQPDSFKTERLVCVETDGQTTDGQG